MKERNLQRPKKTKLLKNLKDGEKGCLRFSYCHFLTFVYFNILFVFWSHFFYKNMLEYVFADKSRICFDFLTGLKPKNNASSCILQNGTSQGVITASAFIPIICIIFYSTALSRRVEKKMKKLLMKSLFRVSLLFAYALFGGGLFYCIEKKPEDNRDVYLRLSRELQTNFTNRFNVSIMENDFKSFIHRAFEVVQVGHKADWSFLSSLSFSLTTLTTVGKWHLFLK